ncbi:MAG: hypothetical protein ACI8PZ_002721 [Myxococcota bacterium]
MVPLLIATGLLGCQGDGELGLGGLGSKAPPRPPLALTVASPAVETTFVGGDSVRVTGSVAPADAVVWVEGRRVRVGNAGDFTVDLPLWAPYRIVDIEAADGLTQVRETRTVLAGDDPLASWPGAVSLVLTPGGLGRIVGDVGALVDGLGWAQLVEGLAPGFVVSHFPTTGFLAPTDDGIRFDVAFHGVELAFELLGSPIALKWDTVDLALLADLTVDDAGVLGLSFGEPELALGRLSIDAFGIDAPFLEGWIDDGLDWVIGLLEGALSLILGVGTVPVFGPIDLELDLLGAAVETRLSSVDVSSDGIAVVLGVGIDGPPGDAGDIPRPPPAPWQPQADLRVGLHEGLFQLVLASDLLDLLDLSNLQLDGFLGNILALPLGGLPGGAVLPEADGWCISLDPGDARVARMPGGLEPLASLYLPELYVDIGYSTPEAQCLPWLQANIAAEALLVVEDGTRIGIDLVVADGTVLYYATELPWDEDGVIDGLGGVIESILSLLGGALEFDLAEIFGGLGSGTGTDLIPALSPHLIDSQPLRDDTGATVEGLHGMTLSLFE